MEFSWNTVYAIGIMAAGFALWLFIGYITLRKPKKANEPAHIYANTFGHFLDMIADVPDPEPETAEKVEKYGTASGEAQWASYAIISVRSDRTNAIYVYQERVEHFYLEGTTEVTMEDQCRMREAEAETTARREQLLEATEEALEQTADKK